MAERVVNHVIRVLQAKGRATRVKPCQTLTTPLTGVKGIAGTFESFKLRKRAELEQKGFQRETAERLVTTYGRHVDLVVAIHEEDE